MQISDYTWLKDVAEVPFDDVDFGWRINEDGELRFAAITPFLTPEVDIKAVRRGADALYAFARRTREMAETFGRYEDTGVGAVDAPTVEFAFAMTSIAKGVGGPAAALYAKTLNSLVDHAQASRSVALEMILTGKAMAYGLRVRDEFYRRDGKDPRCTLLAVLGFDHGAPRRQEVNLRIADYAPLFWQTSCGEAISGYSNDGGETVAFFVRDRSGKAWETDSFDLVGLLEGEGYSLMQDQLPHVVIGIVRRAMKIVGDHMAPAKEIAHA